MCCKSKGLLLGVKLKKKREKEKEKKKVEQLYKQKLTAAFRTTPNHSKTHRFDTFLSRAKQKEKSKKPGTNGSESAAHCFLPLTGAATSGTVNDG